MSISKIVNFGAFVVQQLRVIAINSSNGVKFVWGIVVFSYLLSFWEDAVSIVSITPGYVSHIWTFLTFCFLESRLLAVTGDIFMVAICGKVIEPLWGVSEMAIFFAVTNIGVGLSTTLFYLFLYVCTSNPDYLFAVRINGLSGYIAAVTVAVKQIMPDIQIASASGIRVTNESMPLLALAASAILWICGFVQGVVPVMMTNGVFISWIYLRFYQRHLSGTKGDFSDSFSFASFFPVVLQPCISSISRAVFNILVRASVCRKRQRKLDAFLDPEGEPTSLVIDAYDKDRRRQIALKALSERLSKPSASSPERKSLSELEQPLSIVTM